MSHKISWSTKFLEGESFCLRHKFGDLGTQFQEGELVSQLKLSKLLAYSDCNPYLNRSKIVQAQPKTSKANYSRNYGQYMCLIYMKTKFLLGLLGPIWNISFLTSILHHHHHISITASSFTSNADVFNKIAKNSDLNTSYS